MSTLGPADGTWKTQGRKSLALPDTVHSQEIEQPYFNINSGLLVSTQRSLRPCILFRYTRERERQREAVQMHTYFVFHWSLTKMTDGRKDAPGAHSIRFLVDFRVYKFRSFVSLDGSERSIFFRQSPYQLIV